MKNITKILSLALAVMMLAFCFAACSSNDTPANTADQGGDDGEDAGFTEVEIFSGVEKEFLNLNAVQSI